MAVSDFMSYVRILWNDKELLAFTEEEITEEYEVVLQGSLEIKGNFEGTDYEFLLALADQYTGTHQRYMGLWYEYYNNFVKRRLLNKKPNGPSIRGLSEGVTVLTNLPKPTPYWSPTLKNSIFGNLGVSPDGPLHFGGAETTTGVGRSAIKQTLELLCKGGSLPMFGEVVIKQQDIESITQKVGVSREAAISALIKNEGDVILAIAELIA